MTYTVSQSQRPCATRTKPERLEKPVVKHQMAAARRRQTDPDGRYFWVTLAAFETFATLVALAVLAVLAVLLACAAALGCGVTWR